MKVAVYTIAKNEEQFVQRWYESAKDADYLCILDTGSTDGTVEAAEALGITVRRTRFDPWRFDDARNASLAMVPEDADMCVALDMDEVLLPDWRRHLEIAVNEGVTRPRYQYTWSWDGHRPGLQYAGDKIHARHGYRWKHPVHEVLVTDGVEKQGWFGLEIHHHPDPSKSRSQYLPLLELAVSEDPEDDRNSHYLAREYFNYGMWEKAEAEFRRHLTLEKAVWAPERAQSCRYLYKITGDVEWLNAAIAEAPRRREARVDLAQHYHDTQDWEACLREAVAALKITQKPLEYLVEPHAWGALPHDLAAVAAYRLGYYHEAEYHGMEALKLSPYDGRLTENYRWYREAAA